MSRVKLVFKRGWEDKALQSTDAKRLVMHVTSRLASHAIKAAPRRRNSIRSSWTSTKHNIEAFVQNGPKGWYGNVVVERNKRVRHAMLQNQGFTDRAGRRHPGRHYLKEALRRMRE